MKIRPCLMKLYISACFNCQNVNFDNFSAFWLSHYTLDEEDRQVVIFQNEKCSEITNKKCVLYTKKVADSENYALTGEVKFGLSSYDYLNILVLKNDIYRNIGVQS
jgi:hypothetical protein